MSSLFQLCHNGLALNPDKTDAVLFGTRNKLGSLTTLTHVDVAGTSVQLSKKVKFLEQHLISSSLFRIMSIQYVVFPSITCALSVTCGQLLLKI